MPAIRILLLEDSPLDAGLTTAQLDRKGLAYVIDRVDNRGDFLRALTGGRHDVILADYLLPDFNGIAALELARQHAPHIPFIFVSGGLGEELAVDLLKRGATDYILKDRLDRLAAAIERAIKECRERHERQRAEHALRELNETLEQRIADRTRQLRALTGELIHVELRERRRLAQVLHDHLQQIIVAAKIQLTRARERIRAGGGVEELVRVEELLAESIAVSRSITVELSPPVLFDGDIQSSLAWLARRFQEKHNLRVDLLVDPGIEPLAEDLRVFLFHTARELLFNVVKHSGCTDAAVDVRRFGEQVRLIVEDHGQGFDPGVLNADDNHKDRFGLFSVRERLTLLGGSMLLESSEGCGTSVTVTITAPHVLHGEPAPEPAPVSGDPAASERREPWPDADKIRILLVDDHKILREGLAGLLSEQPDIKIVGQASDGQTAVDLARRLQPAVIVMDISMPLLSGVDATRAIMKELPQTKVIGLSMHNQLDMAESMLAAGAVGFLTKGGPFEDLIAKIRACASVSSDI